MLRRTRREGQGGNPTDNFTAAYSEWIVPSAARMTSGGSTHVRPRTTCGRSVARIIRKSPTRGGSPSRNTTGRRLMRAASAARAAASRRGRWSSGKTQAKTPPGGEVRDSHARVIGDVAAQFEATCHLLRMVSFDSGAGGKIRRAAEHEVEGLARARSPRHHESPRVESRTSIRVRCMRPTCAPVERCLPALRSSQTSHPEAATPQSSRPSRFPNRDRARETPSAPSSSHTTPSAHRRSRSDVHREAGRFESAR